VWLEDRELAKFAARLKANRTPQRAPDDLPLDLNHATRTQLEAIKGIGPILAERIIAARPYSSTDELLKGHGIGRKKLRQLQPHFIIN